MRKHYCIFLILFVGSFCFSQQKTTNSKISPTSIYTFSFKISGLNTPSYHSVKQNLNLNNTYKFSTLSFEDINSNDFTIATNNLFTKPTKLIYDDYRSYRDENLLKGFFEKYDLTRWNVCNFRQPNF